MSRSSAPLISNSTVRPPRKAGAPRRDLLLFLAIFVGVWLLWDTGAVYPLKVLVVLLHEICHGLAAILTGGAIESIAVNADQGGVCYTRGGSRFLTLSAGYLGSMASGAMILLVAARTRYDRTLALVLGLFLLAITALAIRPVFGFGFWFGFAAGLVLVFIAVRLPNEVSDVLLKVIGTTSCLYAILDIKSDILDRPELRSDARMLAEHTGIPTIVWGLLWMVIAAVVTARTFIVAARGEERLSPGDERPRPRGERR